MLIKTASERVLSACYPLLLYYPDLLFSSIKPKPPQLSSSWLQALITQSISGQIKTTTTNQLHFEDFPQHEQQLKQSLSLGGLNVVAKMKVLGFGAQMVLHKKTNFQDQLQGRQQFPPKIPKPISSQLTLKCSGPPLR